MRILQRTDLGIGFRLPILQKTRGSDHQIDVRLQIRAVYDRLISWLRSGGASDLCDLPGTPGPLLRGKYLIWRKNDAELFADRP